MDTSPDKKRLAIILALDMAGFSSRTETDQEGAVAALTALRERVGAAATAHSGRIFNTATASCLNSLRPAKQCSPRLIY